MQFNYDWLHDPTIFAINRLPAHSDHIWYANSEDEQAKNNRNKLCLNGKWKFHYAKNLQTTIDHFEALTYDCSAWDDIVVPGHIQLQGYGDPVYVNTMYPWSGREQLQPGEIPQYDNPVGSYVKMFDLPQSFLGHPLHLTFEGVETAFAVYMNGIFVGYSEDSFTPSHFDVTPYVVHGQNKLAVQVFRYSSASWLEDQDFWRFSGIFREVALYCLPSIHVQDLKVTADLNESFTAAAVHIKMKLWEAKPGVIRVKITDPIGRLVTQTDLAIEANELQTCLTLNDIVLWSAEAPELYHILIEAVDEKNTCVEKIDQHLGLRKLEIRDGVMYLNGQRLIFNGVNRHEFSMISGRAIDERQILEDLIIMKQNNINAVRTSHYPNQSCFYRLCDELGLYVIDETNLETHGTWQVSEDVFDLQKVLPNDDPLFRNAVLDRARSLYERDKNHASVLIWSCGNESYGGKTLFEMSEYFRQVDPSRLVHYEGVKNDRRYNATSDIESQMYTPASEVAAYLDEHHDKPFILCEYAHAMGNSNGALKKYTDLVDRYTQYQGGFIWDFVDQAILKDGVLCYGGDFDERPSDYDFCGNGIVFADRTLTPKMQEVKYCYQPIGFCFAGDELEIYNRHLFTNLAVYDFVFELAYEGKIIKYTEEQFDIAPLEKIKISVPLLTHMKQDGEYTLTVRALYHEARSYASSKDEVAFEQTVYHKETKKQEEPTEATMRISYDGFNIGAVGEHFRVIFSTNKGLVDYTYGNKAFLHGKTARPNYFRAATQNDVANQYGYRYGHWQSASLYQQLQYLGYQTDPLHRELEVRYRYLLWPNDPTYVDVVYHLDGKGKLQVDMTLYPSKQVNEAPEFGYLLTMPLDFDEVVYYGYGPDENYIDRRAGARLGLFGYHVDANLTPYLVPQECGNRTGVRKAWISDDQHHTLEICSDDCELSVLRYLPSELNTANHIEELPVPYQTVVKINAMQMGVAGDNTWGAKTHDEYLLPRSQPIHFSFQLQGH